MDITQRGEVYGVGQGEDFYGIWDLRAEGAPVNRYPKTPEGWQGAWERWRELERLGTPAWRRAGLGWVVLHLLIGITIGFLAGAAGAGLTEALGTDLDSIGDTKVGAAAIAATIVPLTGWLLFVYLRRTALRWIALVGSVLLCTTGVVVALLNLGS